MKPLKTELQDAETLRDLGSASVQIVHDLKNQLNGLKLYATFLRKRLEKAGRPEDEQETVSKLISGLERAAADMNVLVRYGRSVELRRQPGTDLARLLADAAEGAPFETATGLRMALAARIVRAHGGEVSHEGGRIRARLPLRED
ncbi:MAG: hypothetical protein LC795_01925 [Acidobacteria bacterium]|nr:hypothetical protein [Acidobacteriota bacterium]